MLFNKLFILFKNLTIRRKMMITIIGISGLSLFLSGFVSILYHYHKDRDNLIDNLNIITKIIGDNNSISLEFKNSKTIVRNLRTLGTHPTIKMACIYDKSGNVFTSYNLKSKIVDNNSCPTNLAISSIYMQDTFHIFRNILDKSGTKIGTIYINSSDKILASRTMQRAVYLLIVTLIILMISYILSNIFQKIISIPISSLSNSLTSVAISSNYSVRTTKYYNDEIGILANSFNMMINEIEKSNNKLLLAAEEEKSAKILAEKANNAKTTFLSNMSHELRTPMHAILSYSDICNKKLEKLNDAHNGDLNIGEVERCIGIISKSGDRLLSLINSLLDLSKLEAAAYNFKFENYDILEIIKNVKEEVDSLILEKNIAIVIDNCETNSNIEIDVDSITRIIWNIFSNAIKFSPNDSTITVFFIKRDLEKTDDNGNKTSVEALQVDVIDHGIGIPDDELNDIFDQFTQSSKTESGAGGTGLGLPICREIAHGHGGDIFASNNISTGGTTFSLILPVKQDTSDTTAFNI